MIFRPISKYALVNAKVRARLSTLLAPELIDRLAETRDLSEFYSIIGGTIYEPIFSRPEITFDPRVGERMLLEQEAEWHGELLQDLHGAERDLVAHFLEKYEIENLKTALRIREGSRGEDEMKYIIRKELLNKLPYQAISEAASLEDVLPLIAGTPYLDPVRETIDDYHERGTLFPVEIGLEIDYYRRLKGKVEALSKRDREIAGRLIGLEIDQKNIGWLIRLKFYYDVPVGELLDYNIPGGSRMTRDRLRLAFRAETLREVLSIALEKSFGNALDFLIREEQLSRLYLLEIILWNYLIVEARKTLAGFPFTIGTVLSYLILKRTEIRNIITILNGKVYKMGRSEIESHLRVSF
ncbi:MAG: V-type ATPase subunit [bacterium]|nr:MAG: V-type ATPase subunit [bacterium]